jgi:hypothetical protein
MVGGFVLALGVVRPDYRRDAPLRTNALVLLCALALGVHIQRELHLGQVNHILLVLFLAVAYLYDKNRPALLGLAWAASLFLKPVGLIYLPYFLLKRRWRELGWFAGWTAALFATPLLFYSWPDYLVQLQSAAGESQAKLLTRSDMLADANHTIFSILARYTPLGLLEFTPEFTLGDVVALLGLMGVAYLWLLYRGRDLPQGHVLELSAITALIPLLAYTARNAFGFTELAVFLLLANFSALTRGQRALCVVGLIFAGGNWRDLWGVRLSLIFENASLIAVGTTMLVAVLFWVRARRTL